jgi:ATP-dependent 26S proteasome regulatory subunit
MLELLNQLDGFDTRGDVKVIMATNRIDSLDPALIRPGRIDRKIEFPLPDIKTKRHIFKLHTSRMSLAEDVDLEEYIAAKDDLSGADIKAVCTEAGLLALRERRMRVNKTDFSAAREKVSGNFAHLSIIISFHFPGLVPQERGHSRRIIPLDDTHRPHSPCSFPFYSLYSYCLNLILS